MEKVIYQRPNHFSYLKVMREENQLCDVTIEKCYSDVQVPLDVSPAASLTRRVHGLRETDFRGHWRVDFWYLKMKPSADISCQWAFFLQIWEISSQISSISSKNDVSSIDRHIVETQLFPVHRCILAGTMEYFKAMFLKGFKENDQNIISIKNITATNMKALIDFAYTGELAITEDTVHSLIKDADYLMLFDVKEECGRFLESTLNCTNAYKVYCIAEELNCVSLKEQSHKIIRESARNIVQTEEFLGFNYEFLTSILIDNDSVSPTTQFEALMRWIISDFEERKVHLSQILSCSDFFKLTLEYVTDYLFEECIITKMSEIEHKNFVMNILLLYRNLKKKKKEMEPKEHIVMTDEIGKIDIYDPYNNTWKSLETTETGGSIWSNYYCAVHENQLYKVSEKFGLQRMNLQEKKFETLPSVDFKPRIRFAGICFLNDYLYVCGGINAANRKLKDVMRYCPTTKEWRQMSSMQTARAKVAVVALSGQLYAIGGFNNSGYLNTVERYDPQRDCWTTLPSLQCIRYSAGAAVLNGKIFVCGGQYHNNIFNSVEVYDPIANRWDFVATMNEARSNALVVAHGGKLWAFGGLIVPNKLSSVEVYDSEKNSWSYMSEMPTCKGCVLGGILLI